MPDPASMDELNKRVIANHRVEGYGDQTRSVLPCPFCGAADHLVFPVTAALNDYADVTKPATCQECGRTCQMIVKRSAFGNLGWELVQTGGAEPPAWYYPKPRRVEPEELA